MQKPGPKKRPWHLPGKIQAGRPMADRSRDPFYHTARWKRESKVFGQEHPLCAQCKREGFIVPGEITDHIIPKDICPDPWDKSNWERLCKKHHARKGPKDKKQIHDSKRNVG